jgi:hypothetical protein
LGGKKYRSSGVEMPAEITMEQIKYENGVSGRMAIGFAGFAQSGKDTACAKMGLPRAAFADALKEDMRPIIQDLYGFDIRGCTPAEKEIARPWLVGHGAGMRGGDPDYWLHRLQPPTGAALFCITDVRYTNEVQYILKSGGIVIYLARKDNYPANPEEADSILALLRIYMGYERFYPISNDGTPAELAETCWAIVRRHQPNPAKEAHYRVQSRERFTQQNDEWFRRLCDWCGNDYDTRAVHGRQFCCEECGKNSTYAGQNSGVANTKRLAKKRAASKSSHRSHSCSFGQNKRRVGNTRGKK